MTTPHDHQIMGRCMARLPVSALAPLEAITDLRATHAEHLRRRGDVPPRALERQAHQAQLDFFQGHIQHPLAPGNEGLQTLQNGLAKRVCPALSFDGFVCRTYLPEKNWIQTDGNFGVMIGVIIDK